MRLSFTWRATFVWNRKPAQETWRLIPFFYALGDAEGGAEQGGAELGEGGRGGGKRRFLSRSFLPVFCYSSFPKKRYRFLHTASVVSLNPQKDKNTWEREQRKTYSWRKTNISLRYWRMCSSKVFDTRLSQLLSVLNLTVPFPSCFLLVWHRCYTVTWFFGDCMPGEKQSQDKPVIA